LPQAGNESAPLALFLPLPSKSFATVEHFLQRGAADSFGKGNNHSYAGEQNNENQKFFHSFWR
jgi:hypothetical protein